MSTINMQFDTKTNKVKVTTEAKDKRGDPLYEFTMDADTGVIRQIKRDRQTSHERVIEKEVTPSTQATPSSKICK